MGLFDNAPSFEDISKQGTGSGSGLRYLHQGVFPMTFVGAEVSEASNGNLALVMQYDSGFVSRNGAPNILFKHYYLLDKRTLQLPLMDNPGATAPLGQQRLIDQNSWMGVYSMLAQLFGLDIRNVSSIKQEWETHKLKGLAFQVTRQLTARPEQERQVAGTVEYERNPNREGRYFLCLEWVNPIGQLESRRRSFKPKENPNPPANAQAQTPPQVSPAPDASFPGYGDEPPF